MNISFNVSTEKVQRLVDATKYLFKIPQINTGTEENPVLVNEFTDNQWAKEAWRRYINAQVKRYEDFKAKEAIDIPLDNSLLT